MSRVAMTVQLLAEDSDLVSKNGRLSTQFEARPSHYHIQRHPCDLATSRGTPRDDAAWAPRTGGGLSLEYRLHRDGKGAPQLSREVRRTSAHVCMCLRVRVFTQVSMWTQLWVSCRARHALSGICQMPSRRVPKVMSDLALRLLQGIALLTSSCAPLLHGSGAIISNVTSTISRHSHRHGPARPCAVGSMGHRSPVLLPEEIACACFGMTALPV